MERFKVWFENCPDQVFFAEELDAKQYARENGGVITDTTNGEIKKRYPDEPIIHGFSKPLND